MAAIVVFILYVVSAGNLPDFTALAAYPTQDACRAAAAKLTDALGAGQDARKALCISSNSLEQMAQQNDVSNQ